MQEYELIYSGNRFTLENLVNDKIKQGWLPIGGVAVDNAGWYQAMIRENYDLQKG